MDQSTGLLATAAQRLRAEGRHPYVMAGDFHRLPIAADAADLVVAAFCLYHSPQPTLAITEIARCLRPGGYLLATTKSPDSYQAIDEAIAATGLDPEATARPSLYETFHTGNAHDVLAAAGLTLRRRLDQNHTFHFSDAGHVAEYAATCPKYRLPAQLTAHPPALADVLRPVIPAGGLTASSTVTYLLAQRP